MGFRILVLGGTADGISVADRLSETPSLDVVYSLAGTTDHPRMPKAATLRKGGFGGPDGLIAYLASERIMAVIDATHPFAKSMPWHARTACAKLKIPRIRLIRPYWSHDSRDRWFMVQDMERAVRQAGNIGGTAFLTVGVRDLPLFARLPQPKVARVMRQPEGDPLPGATYIVDPGPYSMHSEVALMRLHEIGAVVTRASGGIHTMPKILAARYLSLPVIVIERPPPPPGPRAATPVEAVEWVEEVL